MAIDRIAVEQQLLHGIGADMGDIVGVLVATGEAEDALTDEVDHGMADLAGLAIIGQTGGGGPGQSDAFVDGLEQQGAAVAGRVGGVEGHVSGLGNEGWKQNSLLVRMTHTKAFLVDLVACGKTTLADGEAFVIQHSRIIRVNPWSTYRKYYGQSVEFSDNPDKYMPRLFYRRVDDRVYTHDGASIYSTAATASPLQGWTEEVSGLQPGDYNIRGIAGSNAGDLSLYVTYWNSSVANGRDLTVVTREGGAWQIDHVEDLAPSAGTLQRVAVSELWPGQAWVGVSTPPGSTKLLHTADGGATWDDLTANLADLPSVRTVVPMPHDPDILYVGTELGVYRSTDGGASWSPFMDGLPVARTAELRLIADPQHTGAWQLVLGTDGKGVWSRTVAAPPVIFVDQDAAGPEDGTIWFPYDTLQEALAAAPPARWSPSAATSTRRPAPWTRTSAS